MDEELFGGREALAEPTARWSMGGLFIEALARRDFAAMADCLDAGVRLRALLPSGPVQLTGRDDVVERSVVGSDGHQTSLSWLTALSARSALACICAGESVSPLGLPRDNAASSNSTCSPQPRSASRTWTCCAPALSPSRPNS